MRSWHYFNIRCFNWNIFCFFLACYFHNGRLSTEFRSFTLVYNNYTISSLSFRQSLSYAVLNAALLRSVKNRNFCCREFIKRRKCTIAVVSLSFNRFSSSFSKSALNREWMWLLVWRLWNISKVLRSGMKLT